MSKIKPGYSRITIVVKDSLHKAFKRHTAKEKTNITKHLNAMMKAEIKK